MEITEQQKEKLIERRKRLLIKIMEGELIFRLSPRDCLKYFSFDDFIFKRPSFTVISVNNDETKAYVRGLSKENYIYRHIPIYEIQPSSPIFWITWYKFINLFNNHKN